MNPYVRKSISDSIFRFGIGGSLFSSCQKWRNRITGICFSEVWQKRAKEIYLSIENTLDLISKSPEMYRTSNRREGLRKCTFSKQTSIYYRIKEEHTEVVSFRPNRKDPKKFKV
jgi:plasmid stabilization system protein ParE